MQDKLEGTRKAKSDTQLRKEQIDDEMKNILSKDRDELLSGRIKNYNPSMSVKDKDKLLAEAYDTLQKERDRLDKMPDEEEKPKNSYVINKLPDKSTVQTPEIEFLPYKPDTSVPVTLPNRPGTAEITTLPYRPGTDNGFTKFPRIIGEEVSGEKTTGKDILSRLGIADIKQPSGNGVKMLSNRSDIQPVKYSVSVNNEEYAVRDENTLWNTIDQLTYGDWESVLASEAERWNLPYSPDMNDLQKEKLRTVVYKYLHYELNTAKGADVTSPDQDKDVLQKLYEIRI